MTTVLRQLRETKGLSQRELSERSHICQSLICEMELGVRKPWLNAIRKISTVLVMSSELVFPKENTDKIN
jgi:transcriptional regulator with XRE-family HTH domain